MPYRSTTRTLADLRLLLETLQKNRQQYDPVSFAQLRRIVRRRITELALESRGKFAPHDKRRAA